MVLAAFLSTCSHLACSPTFITLGGGVQQPGIEPGSPDAVWCFTTKLLLVYREVEPLTLGQGSRCCRLPTTGALPAYIASWPGMPDMLPLVTCNCKAMTIYRECYEE